MVFTHSKHALQLHFSVPEFQNFSCIFLFNFNGFLHCFSNQLFIEFDSFGFSSIVYSAHFEKLPHPILLSISLWWKVWIEVVLSFSRVLCLFLESEKKVHSSYTFLCLYFSIFMHILAFFFNEHFEEFARVFYFISESNECSICFYN